MATYVGLHNRVYLGHLDLSGHAHQVNSGTLTRAMQNSETFDDGGYSCVLPGLISGEGRVMFRQDWAANELDDQISVGQLGTQYPFTVVPNPTGTVTAGDAAYIARGLIGDIDPGLGLKGEIANGEFGIPFDTATAQALVLHPLASRTATGNGTAVALTGPSASQKLYAALHVTAYDSITNLVVKVQTDDGSGFSTPTDRITFSTVTGKTSEWSSVAGDFSTETHVRVTYTITGSGSVSFVVAAGVI